jgi:ribonuclease P protein component
LIERIQGRATFRRFGSSARRVRRGPITLVIAERDAGDAAGLAFAVPRRVGGAVVRNRLRRQLRAIAKDIDRRTPVPPAWYLVVVHPGAADHSFDSLTASLRSAFADEPGGPGVRS